ncbi:lysM and putative peptidoglycan-binding domain-containing protein 3-like [Acanthaster planci]|uniref:LysM and putative peptidoglycan-binding domain-containing protein 3-like n=1 Tax=Acanthaster planci TaxID=133434 RepID=A0A8B7ZBE3_ACAPL|nr:lysM and putative peptidoglycan-binding domain-containing protein 3-like [Acanthaster planci]
MTSTAAGSGVKAAVRDKHETTLYTAGTVAVKGANDQLRSALLPAKGQVQNVPNSRVYVFGNADVAEDELNADSQNSIEMLELRPRSGKVKKKRKNVEPVIIERDIESGDTLQIFSLQFGCPVAELKRCNNLINDQDFFALRKIKIPIKQHGLLTEEQEERRRRPNAASKMEPPDESHLVNGGFISEEDESDYGEEDNLLVRQISIRDCMRDKTTARDFLKKMDQDLEKICQATQTQKKSLEEVTSTLTEPRIHPLLLPYFEKQRKRTHWEETCGLTWKSACLIFVLIAVAVPTLVGIYFYFFPHSSKQP